MKDFKKENKLRKRYYWEVLSLILGVWVVYSGIVDEMHHRISIGHNSKGMMIVTTGLMESFYGLMLTVGSAFSTYSKLNNKTN